MSVSHQHQFVSLRVGAAAASTAVSTQPDDPRARMLQAVVAAGRRGADAAVTTRAIVTGWQWLAGRSVVERRRLHADLREAIAQGLTTTRAWLPVALAESDAVLLRSAVFGYVGASPRAVEAREQALDDVVEWFRRDLTLDRVAVFSALLALREPEANARLESLRGRLTDAERDRVREEFAGATDAPTREFFAEWGCDLTDRTAQPD